MLITDTSKLAEGLVGVGFAYPTVALCADKVSPGTHTGGRRMARGVRVNLNISTAENNDFYADNVVAESESSQFSNGTADLEVDGLLPAVERFINGLPEAEEFDIGGRKIPLTRTGRNAVAPNVGFGWIREYKSNGQRVFIPWILPKVKFRQAGFSAETRTATVNYQTQSLTADIMRADDADADWRWMGGMYTTLEEALADLDATLGVAEAGNG